MGQASFSNGPESVLRGITRWEIRDRAQGARQSIIATARACMRQAGARGAPAPTGGSRPSNDPFLELQHYVCEYARILGALGHDVLGIAEQAVHAVCDAYGDEEPDVAVVDAVRLWCAEAHRTSRVG